MNTYTAILHFLGEHFIKGIFISVLVIIFAKLIFKTKLNTEISILILKWIILSYAFALVIGILLRPIFISDKSAYHGIYWIMIFANLAFPVLLLIRNLGKKPGVVLLVSLAINLGWLFEMFVIHMTSMERDFQLSDINPYLPFPSEQMVILKGFLLGVITLVIGNMWEKREP